jgi:heme exporter protein A
MLRVEHIQKSFGQRHVLSDVSMHIPEGNCYTLFGANGSGKTTLSFLVSSLLKPTRGTITYERKSIHTPNSLYRGSVGFLTHSSFLYEHLSGYENLQFFGGLYGVRNLKERIKELSSQFEIETRMHDPVRDLSRGLKQRLSILRAIIHDPKILILDEPFTGLDELSAAKLHTLLEQRKEGKHILITTHNLHRGYRSATTVGILANGKIRFQAARDTIPFHDLEKTYAQLIRNETA